MSPNFEYIDPKLESVVENENPPNVLIDEFALSVLLLRSLTFTPPVARFPKRVPNGELLVVPSVEFRVPVLDWSVSIIDPVVPRFPKMVLKGAVFVPPNVELRIPVFVVSVSIDDPVADKFP